MKRAVIENGNRLLFMNYIANAKNEKIDSKALFLREIYNLRFARFRGFQMLLSIRCLLLAETISLTNLG